jgi:hypothetical protein
MRIGIQIVRVVQLPVVRQQQSAVLLAVPQMDFSVQIQVPTDLLPLQRLEAQTFLLVVMEVNIQP